MGQYLNLDQQILHLAIDKSVMFKRSELEVAKKLLNDINYQNFVSCSKIKFAEHFEPNLLMYKTATFKEWHEYFEMDSRCSYYLMENLLKFERTINSRLSHLISKMMENNEFKNFEKNTLIQRIRTWQKKTQRLKSNKKIACPYNGNKTWELIPKMTFGEMKQLLFWFYDHRQDKYLEIVKEWTFLTDMKNVKDRIDEINRLRNSLAHFRPLTIYLTHGSIKYKPVKKDQFLDNTHRTEAVNFIYRYRRSQQIQYELDQIIGSSNNYVKIKNSQHNVG